MKRQTKRPPVVDATEARSIAVADANPTYTSCSPDSNVAGQSSRGRLRSARVGGQRIILAESPAVLINREAET